MWVLTCCAASSAISAVKLEALGGEVRFNTALTGLQTKTVR